MYPLLLRERGFAADSGRAASGHSAQAMASSEPVSCHSDAGTAPSPCLASLCLPCVELPPVLCVGPARGWDQGSLRVPGGIVLFAGVSHHGGCHLPLVLSFCVSVVL